jgi:hypothetical protein
MAMMNRPQNLGEEEVSGIFTSQDQMERLLSELDQRDLRDKVSVLMTDQTREQIGERWTQGRREREAERGQGIEGERRPEIEHHTKLPEGAATGGLTGGLLGALIGGLTMVGSVLIPGVGLLVAGPLIGILTGGAIGTAAGSLVGALVGAGIPEEEAKFYEKQLKNRGNVLVVAHIKPEQEREIRDLFQRHGAQSVRVT